MNILMMPDAQRTPESQGFILKIRSGCDSICNQAYFVGGKMKRLILLFLLVLCSVMLFAQTEDWQWANSAGGDHVDTSNAIATDNFGNCYIIGTFFYSAIMGNTLLTSIGSNDIFISKIDSNGNWIWSRRAGGTGDDSGTGIVSDSNGCVYITGSFYGSSSFGTTGLVSSGDRDIFIAKLDTNGNWLWANKAGGSGRDTGRNLTLDSNGFIYATGSFRSSASFGTTMLSSSGGADIFIGKLDNNGNWLWAERGGGSDNESAANIATDENGNCYITGLFSGISSFGNVILYSNGLEDILIAKMDSGGDWLWARSAGSIESDGGANIDLDSNGNCYVIGGFFNSASFGSTLLVSAGSQDVFISCLNTSGDWLWAIRAGGSYEDYGTDIIVDDSGVCCITGKIYGIVDFGSTILTCLGNSDAFIARVNTDGSWYWASRSQGNGSEVGNAITSDTYGNYYVTGNFMGTATFGDISFFSSEQDIFVTKMTPPALFADFHTDLLEGLVPLTIHYIDTSQSGYGSIIDWLWDFGDGGTSNEQNPTHIYQNEGVYTVSLTVSNINDYTDTMVKENYIHVLPRNPEIVFTPSSLIDFGITNLGSFVLRDFWIKNAGTATLNVDSLALAVPVSCFEIVGFTMPCQIMEGDSVAVQIKFTPGNASVVSDSLIVYNNSINNPRAVIRLRGTGRYVPPLPPDNVVVVMNGNDSVISWDAVTETEMHTPIEPDYYLIFYNGSNDIEGQYYYLGRSWTLSYVHDGVALHAEHMFYRVRAYKYYGRGGFDFTSLGLVPGITEDEVMDKLQRW